MDSEGIKDVSMFIMAAATIFLGVGLLVYGLLGYWNSLGALNLLSVISAASLVFPQVYFQAGIGMAMTYLGYRYLSEYRTRNAVSDNLGIILGLLGLSLIFLGVTAVMAIPEHDIGEDEQASAQSFNEMGAELGEVMIQRESETENIVYSPLSIGLAFSMVYAGSEGESREELEEFLNVEVEEEKFHESNMEILKSLENPEPDYTYHRMLGLANDIETNIANGIWIREDLDYEREYTQRMEQLYEARTSEESFDQSTVREINRWVEDETSGQIDEVIEDLSPQDVMVLVNAVYFYGDWMEQFDEEKTEKDDFYLRDGSTVEVDMMEQTEEEFLYMEEESEETRPEDHGLQAVRLPYGETGRIGMYVLLPEDIEEFVKEFDQEEFERIQDEMSETEIDLYMPKYKAEHDIELEEVMQEDMGMEKIFEGRIGDWDRMSQEVEGIDRATHKATVEVDEEGTEAAAATAIVMAESADLRPVMRVDQPFMFLIADGESNSILFQGIIQDPS